MLIKAKLSELPIVHPEYSTYTYEKKHDRWNEIYFVCAHIETCGEKDILVLDIYAEDTRHYARMFSDGENAVWYDIAKNKWNTKQFSGSSVSAGWYNPIQVIENTSSIRETDSYFTSPGTMIFHNSIAKLNKVISDKSGISRRKNRERQLAKIKIHVKMVPDDPDDINEFCRCKIFKRYSLILKKIQKNKKETTTLLRCLHCGRLFTVKGKVKHLEEVTCPYCKSETVANIPRNITARRENAQICIFL